MPVGTARVLEHQLVHFFRKRVNWNDPAIAGGIYVGTLPAGAVLADAGVRVNTAFNAATTNVLQMGTTATGGEILANAVVLAGAAGYKSAKSGTAFAATLAVDTDVFVSYTQSGTAASAGQADLWVAYIPNTDQ
jgi:hypothetical protein